jgi:hypothetical protein
MRYTRLFQVECLHGYFGGGCRSLTLAPTEDCAAMLDRYQMVFRSAACGGGAVYAPQQTPPGLLQLFDELSAFTFTLTSSDPGLEYYTEMGAGANSLPGERLFHFSNIDDHHAKIFGASRQLLHAPGEPFAEASLPVRPKISSFTPDPLIQGAELQIIEPLNRQAVWQVSLPPQPWPLPLDLRRLPEGRYTVAIDGANSYPFYLCNRLAQRQWGIVSIYVGGVRQSAHLPEKCRVLDQSGAISPKTFTLALDGRKTIWRYYIIDSSGKRDFGEYEVIATSRHSQPSDASSVSGGGNILFRRQPGTATIDGHAAWVFESPKPLPLLQSPSAGLSLTLRPNGNSQFGERPLRLPYAQPGSMAVKEERGKKKLCSEIYVYV